MAALIHTTGAVLHFVKFRGETAWYFLGTAQVAPEVEGDPAYLPVMNDQSGVSKPFAKIFDGHDETVFTVLNRLDHVIFNRLKDAVSFDNTLANRGIDGRVEQGSLILPGTRGDFDMVFVNDFYGTAAATADLPMGRRYYSGVLGNFRELKSATREKMVACRFDFSRVYDPTTRQHSLFSEDLSGLTLTAN